MTDHETEEPTNELEQAHSNLTSAIEELLSLYGADESMILTDYVVVLVNQNWDDDGDPGDDVDVIVRDGYIPRYRIKGLLSEALEIVSTPQIASMTFVMPDDGDDEGEENV